MFLIGETIWLHIHHQEVDEVIYVLRMPYVRLKWEKNVLKEHFDVGVILT